jgi:hypothetical protein
LSATHDLEEERARNILVADVVLDVVRFGAELAVDSLSGIVVRQLAGRGRCQNSLLLLDEVDCFGGHAFEDAVSNVGDQGQQRRDLGVVRELLPDFCGQVGFAVGGRCIGDRCDVLSLVAWADLVAANCVLVDLVA